MKFGLIELIPYFMALIAFCVFTLLQKRRTKKLIKKFENEAEKSRIIKELIEAECQYRKMKEDDLLVDYPKISNSLDELSIIIERIGINANLDNIEIVPVRSEEERAKVNELIAERETAPSTVQVLLDKKARLVNEMALIKYPILHIFTRKSAKIQREAIIIGLSIAIYGLFLFIKVKEEIKAFKNKTSENNNARTIIDDYLAMQM